MTLPLVRDALWQKIAKVKTWLISLQILKIRIVVAIDCFQCLVEVNNFWNSIDLMEVQKNEHNDKSSTIFLYICKLNIVE